MYIKTLNYLNLSLSLKISGGSKAGISILNNTLDFMAKVKQEHVNLKGNYLRLYDDLLVV